jgi:hypothetical protein
MRKVKPFRCLAMLAFASVLTGCGAGPVEPTNAPVGSPVQITTDAAGEAARAAADAAALAAAATVAADSEAAIAELGAAAAPALTIACPKAIRHNAQWVDTLFSYDWKANPPFTVSIDYGDGRTYENDQDHLTSVFGHRYHGPGKYVVLATLTDAQGQTAQATCETFWLSPAPYAQTPSRASGGSGYTALCSDGTTTSSGGIQGACSSHGGLSGNSYGGLSSGSGSGFGGLTGAGSTYVRPYVRADGTQVRGYYRRSH